jgi:hypothetical protein
LMRVLLAMVLSGAMLYAAAFAQQTPSTEPQTPRSDQQPNQPTQQGQPSAQPSTTQEIAPKGVKISAGSVIPVQLSKTVDAKKAKTGDEVVATVTQDLKNVRGDVLVPKDTKVIGHVTEAQARNKEQKQSELGIAFDHAEIKGDQMQLPMSIQAVIAPPSDNPNASGPEQPSSAPSQSPNTSTGSSRQQGMGGSSTTAPQQGQAQAPPDTEAPSGSQAGARPPITGNTQGVIGISNLNLESASQNQQQGSVLTSEKNNVKIEKGTLMLLRVSQ